MPYNKDVFATMLPDPRFSENEALEGKEASSFGNLNIAMSAFANAHCFFTGMYRSDTDDLTFIIPYATSDAERKWGLIATVAWILSTTTAKILILSAENEDTFKNWTKDKTYDEQTNVTWEQFADSNFDEEKKRRFIIAEIYNTLCQQFCASELLIDKFNVDIKGNEAYQIEVLKRINVISHPRKIGERFHRTKYLNMMLDRVDTEFVCNHDADTILASHGVKMSMAYLKLKLADVVYPFERGFKSQKRIMFKEASPPGPLNSLILTGDMSLILHDVYGLLEWSASYGQSIFFRTSSYKAMGGENENFISWGAEDLERYSRAIRLGLIVARVDAPIVHLEHPRGSDSSSAHESFKDNEQLCDRLLDMSPLELKDYYENVEYKKKYEW